MVPLIYGTGSGSILPEPFPLIYGNFPLINFRVKFPLI